MKISTFFFLTVIACCTSCSKLEEDTSQVRDFDTYFQTEGEANFFTAQVYGGWFPHWHYAGYWLLSEIVTDELARVNRHAIFGWGWEEPQQHDFQHYYLQYEISSNWNDQYFNINRCNRHIKLLEESSYPEIVAPFIAELKVYRTFFYLRLIDEFGNVPIVETADPAIPPCTSTRQEVFDFIEKSVLENIGLLSKQPSSANYGRINYYVAQAILAKLYLNAAVYTGQPAWEKAAAACDAIIADGKYSLATNYFDNFKIHNEHSPELIFAAVCVENNCGYPPYTFSLSPAHLGAILNVPYISFTEELIVPPDFYGTFEAGDERIKSFYIGPQFDAQGNPILDPSHPDPDGPQLNYTPDFDIDNPLHQDGIRFAKYEIPTDCNGNNLYSCLNLSHDVPVFRYADILLMKAEALFRLGNNLNEALSLVNAVRERSGATVFTALSLENILAERGRELFLEGWRRSDLIRFGKFNDAWWNKGPDADDHVNLFPIPQNNIYDSPCLLQNPGY